MFSVLKNTVLKIEGEKVKGQVVDGEGVTSLYSRLRKKHSVLFNSYQNRYHYV